MRPRVVVLTGLAVILVIPIAAGLRGASPAGRATPATGLTSASQPTPEAAPANPDVIAPTRTPVPPTPHPTPTCSSPPTAAATSSPPRPRMPIPTAMPGGRTFTVIGAGDVLLHDGLWSQASRDAAATGGSGYDFDPLFASLRPAVSAADLAVCHLETPLGPINGPFSNYPVFSVPPQVAGTLARLGYDTCSTASNHSIDKGEAGVARTLDFLDAAGIRHAGTARTPAEAATPTILNVNGVRVAHLSYTFSFNGLRRPAGKEWLANELRPDSVRADARRAREAGAEVVIVSLHWGTEYQHAPNGEQLTVARQLLADASIDLILGHHAHVVQPLERIGDKWVAYGMGNEVSYQNQAAATRDGIMPRFTFGEISPGVFRVTLAQAVPIHMWLDRKPVRVYPATACAADASLAADIRQSCRASLSRVRAILGQRGAYVEGLVVR